MSLLVEKIAYLCIQSFRFQTKQTSSMISNQRAFHDKYLKNQTFSRYRAGLIVNIAVRVPRPGTSAQNFKKVCPIPGIIPVRLSMKLSKMGIVFIIIP